MFSTKSIVGHLADYFDKRPTSNIFKLTSIFSEELQELEETNNFVRTWRDIEQAEGTTLDKIGDDVKQLRGSASDEVYRVLLKAKIARNLSDGTTGTLIRILSLILGTAPDEIEIVEKWNDISEREMAAIRLSNVPARNLYDIGMTTDDFITIVQSVVAAGVKVRLVELVGTFQFGDEEIITSEFVGMANEAQTIGGTLGLIMNDEKTSKGES